MSIINVTVGYSNFKGGRTTVELNTTGKIKIENVYKGEKQKITERISVDAKLEKMISTLVSLFKNWKYGIRKGVPDEALYEIEIIDAEKKHSTMKFSIWHNELKSAQVIGEMIKYLKDLVKQITNQKVIL